MTARAIPQRELRNNIGRILREAEAGIEFTVTVRGRPVAHLGPPSERPARQTDVDGASLRAVLAATPVDERFSHDVADLRDAEAQPRHPWPA